MLLVGYLYATLLIRHVSAKAQAVIHISLLVLSLLLLPIGPGEHWKVASSEHPAWLIFRMLTSAVGLPFIMLSATSPLLQAWLARVHSEEPYRMFAVSNFASLAALLSYPSLIEPTFGTRRQSICWSLLYVCFAALCAAAAWQTRNLKTSARSEIAEAAVSPIRRLQWFALAACGSMLLLSVTNHIDENVAAVPLMWILPLAVYLLTFVFSFGAFNLYKRSLWTRLLAFALGILGYATSSINSVITIQISLPLFLGGLFICCLFCHGELNRLRPNVQNLTGFYLLIAAGGAAGAIFVGLIAPVIFNGIYELPIALLFTGLLALASSWRDRNWALTGLWVAVSACMAVVILMNVKAYRENALSLRRSFYGSLRVVQTAHAGPDQQRILFHGTIEHGSEFLLPPRRQRPTTYYGPDSGIGILLREAFNRPKRVGAVGLGVGTIAAYGRPGDQFQFYEINSQVLDSAQALFFYLRESQAKVSTTIGDGRLSLEREQSPPFDILVLDAFSGDAIPVHLLTREALALYLRHLTKRGVIAFHVSNDFLDLAPVVAELAADAGYQAVLVHNHQDSEEAILPADWVLVTNNQSVLRNPGITVHARAIIRPPGLRLWTDDYNNLLSVLKAPELRPGTPY